MNTYTIESRAYSSLKGQIERTQTHSAPNPRAAVMKMYPAATAISLQRKDGELYGHVTAGDSLIQVRITKETA